MDRVRKYPIGIQTFSEIIRSGYVYVDKTDLVWQLAHYAKLPSSAFDKPTEAMTTALPLLYQSGYLTIKDYDPESEMYTLSIPNREVRIGYVDGLMPAYIGLEGSDVRAGFALKFWRALKNGDIDQAMYDMKAYLAGVPYVEGFKEKLKDVVNKEGYAIPYQADGRRVVKVGVSVDADTRTIKDWNVAY